MSRTRTALLVVIALVIIFLVSRSMRSDKESEATLEMPEPRLLQVEDVVAYGELTAHTYRMRSTRDVLPGGLSAAMAPILVDWTESEVAEDGFVVIKNINDGGNPVSGVTVLRSARIQIDGIQAAEFILVPLGGPGVFHGQLRFIFAEGAAEYLGTAFEDAVGEPDQLTDLVVSWEAWRRPGEAYNVLTGMSDASYKLSARGYSGQQRFLEDALSKRDWTSYTLQLPGGQRGLSELLMVSMAMADGAARRAISQMLDHAEEAWLAEGPSSDPGELSAVSYWQSIRDRVAQGGIEVEDARLEMAGEASYQTLVRSCASLALYTVDVATERLIEKGYPHEGMSTAPIAAVDEVPDWMSELSGANLVGIFAHAPAAIGFFLEHPTAIPGEIPKYLDKAGLLVRENGKPLAVKYSMEDMTPWGQRDQLLIR